MNSTHALAGIHARQAKQFKPSFFFFYKNTSKSKTKGGWGLAEVITPRLRLKLLWDAEKQPADSQIRSDRERPCSRRTPGPPPASLLSIQSPSSPRRRSSEGEEEEEEKQRRRGGWKEEGEGGTAEIKFCCDDLVNTDHSLAALEETQGNILILLCETSHVRL